MVRIAYSFLCRWHLAQEVKFNPVFQSERERAFAPGGFKNAQNSVRFLGRMNERLHLFRDFRCLSFDLPSFDLPSEGIAKAGRVTMDGISIHRSTPLVMIHPINTLPSHSVVPLYRLGRTLIISYTFSWQIRARSVKAAKEVINSSLTAKSPLRCMACPSRRSRRRSYRAKRSAGLPLCGDVLAIAFTGARIPHCSNKPSQKFVDLRAVQKRYHD